MSVVNDGSLVFIDCRTCTKVVSWVTYHRPSCHQRKCSYFNLCQGTMQDMKVSLPSLLHSLSHPSFLPPSPPFPPSSLLTQNKIMKTKIMGLQIPRLSPPPYPPFSSPPRTPSLPTPPTMPTVPQPVDPGRLDFDMDVIPQTLIRGAFPKEREIYMRALEERLPEEEEDVRSMVDRRTRMREVRLACVCMCGGGGCMCVYRMVSLCVQNRYRKQTKLIRLFELCATGSVAFLP